MSIAAKGLGAEYEHTSNLPQDLTEQETAMSRLNALLRLVLAWLTAPTIPAETEPEMSRSDWADLPPHHPRADCTPC